MLSNCPNINKQHSPATQFRSLEFLGLNSTKSIRSVVTGKKTKKCKYVKFLITINLSYLRFSRL